MGAVVALSMVNNLEPGRPGMERSRKRTPIFKRSKGAATAALAVSLGCAIFGVGGAVAGDGKYAHHVRQAHLEARLAGLALDHRTPEQLVLAITPKAHHVPAHANNRPAHASIKPAHANNTPAHTRARA